MTKLRYSIIILVIALICLVIQGSLFKAIAYDLTAPNLLLVMVVFLAFFAPDPLGIYLSFILGLLYDLGSDRLLGPQAVAYICLHTILSLLSQRIFLGSFIAIVPVIFLSALFANLIYLFLDSAIAPLSASGISISIAEALITAICAPFLFKLLTWIPGKNVTSN